LLIEQFLKIAGSQSQIVSLGAGYDTLYWQLDEINSKIADPALKIPFPQRYVEVDFPAVTAKKIHHILKPQGQQRLLKALADSVDQLSITEHMELHSPKGYHLLACDLRQPVELMEKLISKAGLSPDLPTLFVCECVLVYMSADLSSALLSTLAQGFQHCCFLNYEQVNIDDKFGQVMQDNLQLRGVSLAGISSCHTLESHQQRFFDNGWTNADAKDLNFVYRRLPAAETKRIESIEMLDEGELLTQLLHHYCICIAAKNADHLFEAMRIR